MRKLVTGTLAAAFLLSSSSFALADHSPGAPPHHGEGPLDTIDDGTTLGSGGPFGGTILGLSTGTFLGIVGGGIVLGIVLGTSSSSSGTH